MKESSGENPILAVTAYESQKKVNYSEFGQEGLGVEHWGTMINSRGERFNGYTNKEYIKHTFADPISRSLEDKEGTLMIADLGGDDGFLLDETLKVVGASNPGLVTKGLVADIDPAGDAQRRFSEKQSLGERKNIEYLVSDITQLPLADESLDVVISRMAMQYLDKEQQEVLLREISRVLKKGGLGIIQTATSETKNDSFNAAFTEITRAIARSSDFKRYFPDFNDYTLYRQFEEKFGFKSSSASRETIFPISVDALAERFKIDIDEFNSLFIKLAQEYPENFETIDGQLCLMGRLFNLRFQKA